MLIAIASDHNGIGLKRTLKEELSCADFHFVDIGPWGGQPVDYVDYANQLASIVSAGDCDRGILICGTGVGMSIAANRYPGIRCALVHNDLTAVKSREHNDANVLALGTWVRYDRENVEAARAWLREPFGERRHVRRVEKLGPNPNNIVFANGVFDILHTGHIEMLRWARSLGSWLVVGLNSDASARALKGNGRPVNGEQDRKAVLENLRFVDEVIIFDEQRPTSLIEAVKPSIVVKGAEWTAAEVRERDQIPDSCQVKVFPTIADRSTTRIIEKIRA